MPNARRRWIAAGLVFFAGCFTPPVKRQFISVGPLVQAAAKQPSDVQVYADASQVPFPYVEMGRITPERPLPGHFQSSSEQISAIRALAAANGADAVILSRQILLKGGTYHSPAEGVVHRTEKSLYSGITIVKSTSAVVAALPTSTPTPLVSIPDLFAVPDSYLNQTVLVEGIYSQLTVGQQATAFLLTASVNNQLELLCAYRNTELDENSRRWLMNQPNKSTLRLEGHLVRSSQGSAKEAGLSGASGFEFVVTRVLH